MQRSLSESDTDSYPPDESKQPTGSTRAERPSQLPLAESEEPIQLTNKKHTSAAERKFSFALRTSSPWTDTIPSDFRQQAERVFNESATTVIRLGHMTAWEPPVSNQGVCAHRYYCQATMAEEREPPPLVDETQADFEEVEDDEDLFSSAVTTIEQSSPTAPEPASLPAEDISTNTNGPKQEILLDDEDHEDLFPEATEEVSLDSPEREPILSDGPSPAITPVTPTGIITPTVEDFGSLDETSLNHFSRNDFSVKRRFSDFLGLHSKLASKYMHIGYIVPPAPEKSIVGMTKVKVGKEDLSSTEFVEKRRAALERYLMRTVNHPALIKDPDVIQFLENTELPRAVSTQALSGAGILRMVNKAADAVNKMTIKMNESDAWFEEKQQQFENLDTQLRKLHASVESLVCHRKELSLNTASFAKSAAMLGNSEDHTALSRALSQLAEVEEKIDQLYQEQAYADFYMFSELLGDYVRLITAVKGVFDQRMKIWSKWQDAQLMLQRKKEAEAKLQYGNKPDKLQQAKDEIKEWEAKVQQGERDFEQISKNIRREVGRFEKQRVKDFKFVIIKYLESLVHTQQQLIKYWEAFVPEAKAIA
ncbi:Sorting nexin-2 [Bagarius yarrelli]|uniref:Sorting nexin-2 n=1 Tax=Bagarius yarrelli TaxID=175774 RepID=A0A556TXM2_BAGYA|nr:Sorting nexin-2 [Bagarius yarrelli]